MQKESSIMSKKVNKKTAAVNEAAVNEAAVNEQQQQKHAIFNDERAKLDVQNRVKERQAKALAQAQRENKVNNTLITATIYVRSRITKTATIEIALSVAAQHVSTCSCAQVADFINKELSVDSVSYKHESSNATRIRNHVRDAMSKLVICDANDMLHFTEKFAAICKDETHIARINALIAEIKKQ